MEKGLTSVTIPAPRDVWAEVTRQDPHALISQTPEWIDCICKSGPYRNASRLYEFPNGRLVVLPAVCHESLPASLSSEKSIPHGWGIGGPVAPGGVRADEISWLVEHLSNGDSQRISIRPSPLLASTWQSAVPSLARTEPHVAHILDLEGGFDHVWNRKFDSATRNKIRKAEKSGLVIEKDTSGQLLPDFYRIYLDWSERRARERNIPVALSRWMAARREPLSKFEAVANIFGDACRLWVARLDSQVAAAAFLLVYGDHAIYWRSASSKELTLQTRANDLLQKVMVEEACLSGCRYYHMGESGGVASLMHFKSRFGAVEFPYQEYFFGRQPLEMVSKKLGSIAKTAEQVLLSHKKGKAP